MTDWYYHAPGQGRVGPLTAEQMQQRYRDRVIVRDTLAARRLEPAAPRADGPVRIFFGPELDKLDLDCRGFLMFLEQQGILDADQRELVVDRAMALDQDELDLDDLKWVVLMVLFNQPGSEAAYAWMETQMFEDDGERVH